MKKDDFKWLQQWYQAQCDGDWEHKFGIFITTLDNPGWSFTVDLEDTELENKTFKPISFDRSDNDWVCCFIKDKKFQGRCGSENFTEILKTFRDWVEQFSV